MNCEIKEIVPAMSYDEFRVTLAITMTKEEVSAMIAKSESGYIPMEVTQ